MKTKIILLVLIAAFFCACQTENTGNQTAPAANSAKTENANNVKTFLTEKGVFTVELKSNPTEIKAGEKTDLTFIVKNTSGETVKDLQIVHEKPMHLLIVSDDLDEFYHEHPEAQADGSYKVSFAFPNGGNYKLYADFKPFDTAQVVQDFAVKVSGNERAAKPLIPDEKLEKTVENLRVEMKPDGELASNKEMLLSFNVFDAATNQPVTDLENYLGAKAHFVVISKDLQEFVHAHPLSDENVKTEEHVHASATEHKDKMANPNAASTVSAHLTFPKAAVYKIFAQFKRGGKIFTVPFTVDVKEGEEEKGVDTANVKIPEGAVKIVVSKDGFTPQEISFKQGQPLKLAFYRADAENCGSEVVFKDLNIRKKLPVGEVVSVDVPTGKTGEISFACGMDMYRGKIVVQ
jgi:hypothetical protein